MGGRKKITGRTKRATAARKPRSPTQRARPSSAEDFPARPATKALRVAHVLRLMCSNGWVTGITGPELAEEWGLTVSTLKDDAASASNQIKNATPEADVLIAQLRNGLQSTIRKADAAGEHRTVIAGITALADITGVRAPQKLEVKGDLASILCAAEADPDDDEKDADVWTPPEQQEPNASES